MEKKLNKAEGYRKLLKIVVTLLVLIGLLGMMYSDEVKPIAEQRMQYVKSEVKGKLLELKSGEILSQKVEMQSDSFETIQIMYQNFQGQETDVLTLEIENTEGEIIGQWELQLTNEVIDHQTEGIKVLQFNADETIHIKDREVYTLNLELSGFPEDRLYFYGTESLHDKANINGSENEQALAVNVLGGKAGGVRYFFFGIAVLTVFGMGIILVLLLRRESVEKIFVGSALVFGVIYMLVIPSYAVPDEQAHFVTAYNNSSEILGKETVKDAFSVALDVQGKNIIIIDDVYSTGSTIAEAIRTLYGNGANKVTAILLAVNQMTESFLEYQNLTCPICGNEMTLRMNNHNGKLFFGCKGYKQHPETSYTIDVEKGLSLLKDKNKLVVSDIIDLEDEY